MSETIIKKELFSLPEGTAYSIRITNNTGDYIDVTNYGARLLDMFVHTPSGEMKNIMCGIPSPDRAAIDSHPETILFGADLNGLSDTIWDIVEETNSSVMMTAETPSNVKAGIMITWVNLNRLILDFFVTPKEARTVRLASCLSFDKGEYEVSSFSQEVNGLPVSDTPYSNMTFIPLKDPGDTFCSSGEDIKPMLEVKDTASPLRISLYSTMECAMARNAGDHIELTSFPKDPEELLASETLTERVICGIDYITTNLASDENDPESPFLGFF